MAIVTSIDKTLAVIGDTVTLTTSGASGVYIRTYWISDYDSNVDSQKSLNGLSSEQRMFADYTGNKSYDKTLTESHKSISSLTPMVLFLSNSSSQTITQFISTPISTLLSDSRYKSFVKLGDKTSVRFDGYNTEYYVNVTEEEIGGLEGVSVKLECGDENKVSILSSSDYSELQSNLEKYEDYADERITGLVEEVIQDITGDNPEYYVNYSQWSGGLKDIEDEESPVLTVYDIDNAIKVLQTLRDNVICKSNVRGFIKSDGSVDPNSYVTDSKLSNYVQKSATTGLLKNNGSVDENKYALSTHKHGGNWKFKTMNSYCWIYYNEDLRMVYFRYARANYKFPQTGTITLHSKLMKDFKPKFTTPLSGYHYDIVAFIEGSNEGDGTMKISSNETKTKHYLSFTGVWVY